MEMQLALRIKTVNSAQLARKLFSKVTERVNGSKYQGSGTQFKSQEFRGNMLRKTVKGKVISGQSNSVDYEMKMRYTYS